MVFIYQLTSLVFEGLSRKESMFCPVLTTCASKKGFHLMCSLPLDLVTFSSRKASCIVSTHMNTEGSRISLLHLLSLSGMQIPHGVV